MGGSLAPVRVAGFTWNGWQPSAVYACKRLLATGLRLITKRTLTFYHGLIAKCGFTSERAASRVIYATNLVASCLFGPLQHEFALHSSRISRNDFCFTQGEQPTRLANPVFQKGKFHVRQTMVVFKDFIVDGGNTRGHQPTFTRPSRCGREPPRFTCAMTTQN